MKAIERSSILAYEKRREEIGLKKMLGNLSALECKQPGVYGEDILKIKQELELYEEERFRGSLVRARAIALAVGETPNTRVLSLERKHAQRKNVEILMFEGVEVTQNEAISRTFSRHYELLFASKSVDSEIFIRLFLDSVPRLSEEVTSELEAEITELEVQKAIEKLNLRKSQRPDGLIAVLYKTFKVSIARVLTAVFH